MFSPALVRYIVDPDNTLEESGNNKKDTLERHVFKINIPDLNKIKEDYGFFHKILLKIQFIFNSNKKCSDCE